MNELDAVSSLVFVSLDCKIVGLLLLIFKLLEVMFPDLGKNVLLFYSLAFHFRSLDNPFASRCWCLCSTTTLTSSSFKKLLL